MEKKSLNHLPECLVLSSANFKHGHLLIVTGEVLTNEVQSILIRFAKVFEHTYTRFLDLQKAEKQARETQVELSLERIRSRVTEMQESSDLFDIVVTMRNEFLSLGHEADYFWHMKWAKDNYEMSMTAEDGGRLGMVITVPKFVHDNIPTLAKWEKSKKPTFVLALDAEDAWDYIENMNTHGHYQLADPNAPTKEDIEHIGGLTFIIARTTHGEIGFSLAGKVPNPPKASIDILVRFASVFDLAYKRFEDLQNSEAQARETQIELALEKVRSQSMAMQHSNELQRVIEGVYERLVELDIEIHACTIITASKKPKELLCWFASNTDQFIKPFRLPNNTMLIIKEFFNGFKKKRETFSKTYSFKEKNRFFNYIFEHTDFRTIPEERQKLALESNVYNVSNTFMGHSGIQLNRYSDKPFSKQENEILVRFGKVFEQSYIRFLDLKKAEAQARKSEIELALERVRARTMAMQHSDELQEASFLLDEQVRALGINTWGCAFNIYGDKESTEWFGNEAGVLPTYTVPHKGIFKEYYDRGQRGETLFVQEFSGEACVAHYEFMSTLPVIGEVLKNLKKTNNGFPNYQIDHVVYFKYGYLLFITKEPVPESHDIFKRFAKVFEQTYTRFLDLKKAEAQSDLIKKEKERLEVALSELKATQSQLIQSEKMASLGELTAGIAHEIQNPLNFVNNFSEVSKELLDEMLEEIENGDMEEVKAIMDDVVQNLEKINHHGKRADGIVKGMLQHSRASGSQKEPTDINALADEYLRLAYHGLRAKDKSFNATLITDFDDTLEKVNVIPQDIGRVVLNLLTNAFYAVSEKKNQNNIEDFEPTVSITTKKDSNKVNISVKDNGNGIPKHVIEKIYQPFFTTKPTGQGTGLGLSMSYDIVTKGHGGELKVNTKQGMGTEFIIKLPI